MGVNSDVWVIQASITEKISSINPSHNRAGVKNLNEGNGPPEASEEIKVCYFAFESSLAALISGVNVLKGSAALKKACCGRALVNTRDKSENMGFLPEVARWLLVASQRPRSTSAPSSP